MNTEEISDTKVSERIRNYYAWFKNLPKEAAPEASGYTGRNRWIADRGYGTGMALAFEGDVEFVRRSCNFAANFLIDAKASIYQMTPSFAIVNTTMENLVAALEFEGSLQKALELRQKLRPSVVTEFEKLQDEDFPADYDERCAAYQRAVLSANSPEEVKAAEKLNPCGPNDALHAWPEEIEEQIEAESKAWGKTYAQAEIAKLEFEDFMRHVSRAGVSTHEFSEQTS